MVALVRASRTHEKLSRDLDPTAQSIINWVAQAVEARFELAEHCFGGLLRLGQGIQIGQSLFLNPVDADAAPRLANATLKPCGASASLMLIVPTARFPDQSLS